MGKEKLDRRIIVAVAPVGRSVAPPSLNPLTPEAVAAQVVECEKAGASMVHLHVRDKEGNRRRSFTISQKPWISSVRVRTSSFRVPPGGFRRSHWKSDAWR
jgi:uncharacterized protein (DUF849 family)